jgi:hypothetical protein
MITEMAPSGMVLSRLLTLPGEVMLAETDLLAAEWDRQDAAAALQRTEDALLLDSEQITGKNEGQRSAQLRSLTEIERRTLQTLERTAATRKARLHALQMELGAMKAAARLLAARDD